MSVWPRQMLVIVADQAIKDATPAPAGVESVAVTMVPVASPEHERTCHLHCLQYCSSVIATEVTMQGHFMAYPVLWPPISHHWLCYSLTTYNHTPVKRDLITVVTDQHMSITVVIHQTIGYSTSKNVVTLKSVSEVT